ncbi:MAG: AI-2E family transporter [Phycisphaerales bacterium JB060]
MAKAKPDSDPPEPSLARAPWFTRHLWQIQPIRDILVFAAVFGVLYLGYVLRTVTVPLLLALLLAYLLEPVVCRLEKSKHFTRQGAVSGILFAVVLFVAVPASLAVGFAVVQGVDIASTTTKHIDRYMTVTGYVRTHDGSVVPHFNPDRGRNDDAQPPRYELQFYERVEPIADEMGGQAEPESDTPPVGELVEGAEDLVLDDDAESDAPASLPRGERVVNDEANAASRAFGGLPDVLKPGVHQYLRSLAHDLDADDRGDGSVGQLLDWGLGIVRGNAARMTDAAVQGGRITLATGLATVTSIGMLLFGLFLTGFFFFFLSTGYAHVRGFGYEVLPHQHKDRIVDLLRQMDRVVAGFVRGRITIAIIQSVIFTIAYWLIGVPAPLIFGPLVGILSIVPYVALLGIPLTITALALDNSGMLAFQQTWWWTLIAPVAVYFAGQAVDDYLLTPAIQGKATNMDTPTILFASLAGGILAGIYGLLLAIPVAACVKILLRELFWPRFHAWLRGEEKDFLPLKR